MQYIPQSTILYLALFCRVCEGNASKASYMRYSRLFGHSWTVIVVIAEIINGTLVVVLNLQLILYPSFKNCMAQLTAIWKVIACVKYIAKCGGILYMNGTSLHNKCMAKTWMHSCKVKSLIHSSGSDSESFVLFVFYIHICNCTMKIEVVNLLTSIKEWAWIQVNLLISLPFKLNKKPCRIQTLTFWIRLLN